MADTDPMTPLITVRDHSDLHVVITALTLAGQDLTEHYATRTAPTVRDLAFMVDTTTRICALLTVLTGECTVDTCKDVK